MPLFSPGGKLINPTDDIIIQCTTGGSASDLSYTKRCEVRVAWPGKYRVKFDLHIGNISATAYGQIYKNGVAYGTERSNQSVSFITYSEDLVFNIGDLVQLYCKTSNGTYPYYELNFSVDGDYVCAYKNLDN